MIEALYDDADIAATQPLIPRWKDIFLNAVPRPSVLTKVAYNEVSNKFWTATHEVLAGTTPAATRSNSSRRPRRAQGRRLVSLVPRRATRRARLTGGRRPPAPQAVAEGDVSTTTINRLPPGPPEGGAPRRSELQAERVARRDFSSCR